MSISGPNDLPDDLPRRVPFDLPTDPDEPQQDLPIGDPQTDLPEMMLR